MSDLKVLFHSPEELTDRDLGELRSKLRFQAYSPFMSAGFLGLTSAIMDVHMFRRNYCMRRVALFASLGFVAGGNISSSISRNILHWRNFDQDLVDAHDKRYAKAVLNSSGLSSNWVHSGNTMSNPQHKPY